MFPLFSLRSGREACRLSSKIYRDFFFVHQEVNSPWTVERKSVLSAWYPQIYMHMLCNATHTCAQLSLLIVSSEYIYQPIG